MSMYTRCAHCETVFRVTPQQLQLSSGQVRCGRCQQVFDAFSTLSSQLPGSVSAPPPPLTAVALPDEVVASAPGAQAAQESRAQSPVLDEAFDADYGGAGRFVPAEARAPASAETLTLPEALFEAGRGGMRDRWPWLGAHALLLVLAVAQAAWFFPTELAARWPGLRPALAVYCGMLACDVSLPRLPEQLFIEASDLQVLDPARPSEVLLTATVRNRAPILQDLPLLELTLTNADNQTAARKVFRPADYLEKEAELTRGIGANAEISIRLYLDTGRIQATGYRLYLFFA